ncbi:methanol dehydrogenase activator [Lachnospiraceae bacterium]|nr:methanol dehydrogenase activator [Lachnospiraceae bacterium]
MGKILNVTQVTDNRFLNMYDLDVEDKNGNRHSYQVASRARHKEALKLSTGENKPDGVIIYALYGEKQEQVVLIRQYRYSIGTYIYEFPAGLVDEGEDFHAAGIRELWEETGLTFHPIETDPIYSKPYFTTIGMTDEACAAVYGTAEGEISKKGAGGDGGDRSCPCRPEGGSADTEGRACISYVCLYDDAFSP